MFSILVVAFHSRQSPDNICMKLLLTLKHIPAKKKEIEAKRGKSFCRCRFLFIVFCNFSLAGIVGVLMTSRTGNCRLNVIQGDNVDTGCTKLLADFLSLHFYANLWVRLPKILKMQAQQVLDRIGIMVFISKLAPGTETHLRMVILKSSFTSES